MKTTQMYVARCFWLFGLLATIPNFGQSGDTPVLPVNPQLGKIAWGSETNGLTAGLFVAENLDRVGPPYTVWITIRANNDETNLISRAAALSLPASVGKGYRHLPRVVYFMATNSCWGPMELINPRGRRLPPLARDISSAEAYPPFYDVTRASVLLLRSKMIYSGPPLPEPVSWVVPRSFNLNTYFRTKRPGQYRLTVWPKVYKRVAPDSEMCQRIDLPHISVPLNLGGEDAHKP